MRGVRQGAALALGLLALSAGAAASGASEELGSLLGAGAPFDPSDVTCDGCELMVAFLGAQISDDAVDEALLKRLESFCVLLPNETTEDECKELVMEKGLMFLSLLKVALANPEVFCQDLGLCPLNPPPNFAAADGAIPRRAKQPSA